MKKESLLAYFCLAGICIIWGTTFLVMRIGVMHFPPFLFAAIRQLIAGALLCGFIILIRKENFPSLNTLRIQAFRGFLMITCGNGLVSWAEVFVPSGLAAIICSTMPVMVILINLSINRTEMPNWIIGIGVAAGLAGIILVFSEFLADFANPNYRLGIILIFVATLTWAVGSILTKRTIHDSNPFLNAGLQMFFGGFFCLPFSFAFDDLNHIVCSSEVLFALGYLIVFGSIMAFSMYAYTLSKLPITIASLYSYVNPLVAVVLGWFVLQEKLNLKIGIAFLVTVTGIYLVNYGYYHQKKKQYQSFKV
ncbi:MAG: EamA family transporter [Flammeovirgaceae bacterium]|nr:EamA family transporter [Flammeovirgaceae bacterium]